MHHEVAIVLYPGVAPFDVAGPAQAFSAAGDRYRLHCVSVAGGSITTDCAGLTLGSMPFDTLPARIDTLLLPGGLGVFAARHDAALIAATRDLAARAVRIATVCVGAFLAAEAGLLTGRRATTHWRACDAMRAAYPDVRLDPDAIYVRDGSIWSSAGISAGVDLALALIEHDHGADLALQVARELVVFLKRPGGQSQFSATLRAQSADAQGRFGTLIAWIGANLDADLSAPALAEHAAMSLRSFARAFPRATGMTPARFVESVRIEAARALIEAGTLPLSDIARRCGLGDEQRLRRAFRRQTGITPDAFRSRFAAPAQSSAR